MKSKNSKFVTKMIKIWGTYHTIVAEGKASFKFVRIKLNDSQVNPSHVCLNFFAQNTYVTSTRIDIHNETEAAKEAPLKPSDVQ